MSQTSQLETTFEARTPVTNFRCRIAAHSITRANKEAITFDLCCERFIWAEVMTHRWSRNASSSRAIPYRAKKPGGIGMVDWTLRDPAMPLHFGTNKPGMQSGAEIEDDHRNGAKWLIRHMLSMMVLQGDTLHGGYGLHKEIINRYLEPWGWINSVHTMGRDQLMNFFSLRCSKFAHPNMQRLAVNMARAYRESKPRLLEEGEWHLPFTDDLGDDVSPRHKRIWSVARCAWCSYKTVDQKDATFEDAKRRHDDCVNLKHMTPCEHQLQARYDTQAVGCVPGYNQYRHMIAGESAKEFDFSILDTVYADRDYVVG